MGIPLIAGRYFTEEEALESSSVVVISKQFADGVFPNEDPIGKRLIIGVDNPQVSRIVGIVGDVKDVALGESTFREMYVPTLSAGRTNLIIRADVSPLSLVPEIRAQVRTLDKDQPISNVSAMDDVVRSSAAQQWINMVLFAVFASAALILGGSGLYGVISYSVAQRTHEIGIRMALGATRRDVILIIANQGIRLTAIGLGLGLAAALGLTRVMSGLLFGISATDPATFVGVSGILVCVALLACYVPARRATATDPVDALRSL
jgi:putative ABC transport system permease protein